MVILHSETFRLFFHGLDIHAFANYCEFVQVKDRLRSIEGAISECTSGCDSLHHHVK